MNQKPKADHEAKRPEEHRHIGDRAVRGLVDFGRRGVFDIRPDALEKQRIAEIADMGVEPVAQTGIVGIFLDRQQGLIGDEAVRDALRAAATRSLMPGTGVLTERVAIRPSTQGTFTSY